MSVVGCLTYGVLFRVDAQALLKMFAALDVSGAARTAAGETVLHAARRTVVASGDEMVGLYDDGCHLPPRTVRTLGDHLRNLHEIFVPAWTRINDLFIFHVPYCSTFCVDWVEHNATNCFAVTGAVCGSKCTRLGPLISAIESPEKFLNFLLAFGGAIWDTMGRSGRSRVKRPRK